MRKCNYRVRDSARFILVSQAVQQLAENSLQPEGGRAPAGPSRGRGCRASRPLRVRRGKLVDYRCRFRTTRAGRRWRGTRPRRAGLAQVADVQSAHARTDQSGATQAGYLRLGGAGAESWSCVMVGPLITPHGPDPRRCERGEMILGKWVRTARDGPTRRHRPPPGIRGGQSASCMRSPHAYHLEVDAA